MAIITNTRSVSIPAARFTFKPGENDIDDQLWMQLCEIDPRIDSLIRRGWLKDAQAQGQGG